MAELGAVYERDSIGGDTYRLSISTRPIAYLEGGIYRRISNEFEDSGIPERPQIITAAPLMASVGDGGTRRLHPTRELDVYAEIGRPYNVSTRQPYPLNAFTRSGNLLTSTNTLANVYIWHGGHLSKLGIQLKGAWRTNPPAQFAFPVGLQGLTWSNGTLLKNGVPVMRLSAPVVYDMDNEQDRRPIAWDFQQLAGQWYVIFTLPNLSSSPMSRPLIDPTLTLQPDSSAGIDTFIDAGNPTTNQGGNASLFVGNPGTGVRRTLIKFDLSSLPDGSAISSTTFSLFCVFDNSSNARNFNIYRSKVTWTEAGATWNTKDGSNNWTTAGGFASADCEQSFIATRAFSASDGTFVYKDWSVTAATKSDLDLGFGWLIKNDGEVATDQYGFRSSDHTTAIERPELEIVYTAPGLLPKIMQYGQFSGGTL